MLKRKREKCREGGGELLSKNSLICLFKAETVPETALASPSNKPGMESCTNTVSPEGLQTATRTKKLI